MIEFRDVASLTAETKHLFDLAIWPFEAAFSDLFSNAKLTASFGAPSRASTSDISSLSSTKCAVFVATCIESNNNVRCQMPDHRCAFLNTQVDLFFSEWEQKIDADFFFSANFAGGMRELHRWDAGTSVEKSERRQITHQSRAHRDCSRCFQGRRRPTSDEALADHRKSTSAGIGVFSESLRAASETRWRSVVVFMPFALKKTHKTGSTFRRKMTA